jgi:hypothetical protein
MARNDWGGFLKSFCAAFPGWRWETTNLYASGDMVILETSERSTWTKPQDLLGVILEPSGETFEAARARALAVAPPPSSRITWEGIEWLHPSAQAGRPEAGRRHPPEAYRRRNDPRTTPRSLGAGGAMRC